MSCAPRGKDVVVYGSVSPQTKTTSMRMCARLAQNVSPGYIGEGYSEMRSYKTIQIGSSYRLYGEVQETCACIVTCNFQAKVDRISLVFRPYLRSTYNNKRQMVARCKQRTGQTHRTSLPINGRKKRRCLLWQCFALG